jgi:ABC-type nickel/cobalt efflux system permease component RcnA
VFLGLVVTLTHTLGVYLLGLGTLAASAWVVPERLYPWISVLSGLLVVGVGASLVTSRLVAARAHDHHHDHAHGHDHAHDHHHGHEHHHGHSAPTARSSAAGGRPSRCAACSPSACRTDAALPSALM